LKNRRFVNLLIKKQPKRLTSINLSLTKQAFRQPFNQKIDKKVDEHQFITYKTGVSSTFLPKNSQNG